MNDASYYMITRELQSIATYQPYSDVFNQIKPVALTARIYRGTNTP